MSQLERAAFFMSQEYLSQNFFHLTSGLFLTFEINDRLFVFMISYFVKKLHALAESFTCSAVRVHLSPEFIL